MPRPAARRQTRDWGGPVHEVIILLPGTASPATSGAMRATASVTLIAGVPNVIVDTGDVTQRAALLGALAQHHVDPSAVAFVVNTHGHLDHIGNNNLFPNATFLLDADVAHGGEYRVHDYALGDFTIECRDGGPSIRVVATPGHTDHDLTVVVETATGAVAVAGDLFEYDGDDADGAWQRWTRNETLQRKSRERIRAAVQYIVPGHGGMFRV